MFSCRDFWLDIFLSRMSLLKMRLAHFTQVVLNILANTDILTSMPSTLEGRRIILHLTGGSYHFKLRPTKLDLVKINGRLFFIFIPFEGERPKTVERKNGL